MIDVRCSPLAILLTVCLVLVSSSAAAGQTAGAVKLLPQERTNISVYEKCNKAVVNIAAAATPEGYYFNIAPQKGVGSGTVISEDGYIVTNDHVVRDTDVVRVTFFDGSNHSARIVGRDPSNDLAVLKVLAEGKKFNHLSYGDSAKLKVGRRVLAIGNPFGMDRTMTEGIISSLGRTMGTRNGRLIKGIIQTDAAINPGNSGGPLLDTGGRLIGITTGILSPRAGQSSGIGFAIPSNIVKRIVPELIKYGRVIRPDLGILAIEKTRAGLRVFKLDPFGPAKKAGMREPKIVVYRHGPVAYRFMDRTVADTITHVDNLRVRSVDDLLSYVEKLKPDHVVTLTVLRGRGIVKIPVKLTVTRSE